MAVVRGQGGEGRVDPERLRVWRLLLTAHRRLTTELERELGAATGLSLAEYDVLLHLSEAPERRMRMSELSDAVLFTTSGLTRLVDRMEAAGLVRRGSFPGDRRGVSATLTDAGTAALRSAARIHLVGIGRLFADQVDDADLPALDRVVTRLAGGATDDDIAPPCVPADIADEAAPAG